MPTKSESTQTTKDCEVNAKRMQRSLYLPSTSQCLDLYIHCPDWYSDSCRNQKAQAQRTLTKRLQIEASRVEMSPVSWSIYWPLPDQYLRFTSSCLTLLGITAITGALTKLLATI